MDDAATVKVSVPNDYGRLTHVVWAPITGSPATLSNIPEILDAGLIRQAWYNRMMPFDTTPAAEQHREFKRVLEEHGVTVHEATALADTMTQFGTRDIGVAIDDVLIVARPRRSFRQREIVGLRAVLPLLSDVAWLDAETIEGGDVALHEGEVLIGMSEETDSDGIDAVRHVLVIRGNSRTVVPLTFSRGGVIHLDTALVVIGPRLAVCHPGAFEATSLKLVRNRFELIELTDGEAYDVQVNVVPIGDGKVVVKHDAARLIEQLERHGQTPVAVDYSALTPLPGSCHCTTLPLVREP